MTETSVLLKDYVLPVVVLLGLLCTIMGSIFIVASVVVGARSKSPQCKNRMGKLGWQLKALKYTKLWTLLFVLSSVLGVATGFIIGEKALLYTNFFMAVLFLMFFLGIRRAHELVSKEFNSIKAILGN